MPFYIPDTEELKKTLSEQAGKIAEQETKITDHETRLGDVEEAVGELETRVDTTEQNLTDQGDRITTIEQNLADQGNRITTIEQDLDSQRTIIEGVQQDITNQGNQITIIEQNLVDQGDKITTLEQNLVDQGDRITTIEQDLDSQRTIIEGVQQDITNQGNQITIIEQNLVDQGNQITIIEQNLVDQGDQITIIEQNLVDQGNRITTIEQDLVDQGNRITTIEQNLADINSRIGSVEQVVTQIETLTPVVEEIQNSNNPPGTYPLVSMDSPWGSTGSFVTHGSYLFALSPQTPVGLEVWYFEQSTLELSMVGRVAIPYASSGRLEYHDGKVFITYYATTPRALLHIVDVSNPTDPQLILDSFDLLDAGWIDSTNHQIAIYPTVIPSRNLILINNVNQGITIGSIADPANPVLLGKTIVDRPFDWNFSSKITRFDDNRIAVRFVSASDDRTRDISYDISNPANPTQRWMRTRNVRIFNEFLYHGRYLIEAEHVSTTQEKITIYDLITPTNPKVIGSTTVTGQVPSLLPKFIVGNLLYCTMGVHNNANSRHTMAVFDLSNPAGPTLIYAPTTPTQSGGIDMAPIGKANLILRHGSSTGGIKLDILGW